MNIQILRGINFVNISSLLNRMPTVPRLRAVKPRAQTITHVLNCRRHYEAGVAGGE